VRKHGLTVDDLLAVEVVTADGARLHVDSERHRDLFWALSGGGGNFGVVTRLHYRLHRLDGILGGLLVLPASPASLMPLPTARRMNSRRSPSSRGLPPLPFVSSEHHGRLALMVRLAYAGDPERGERALARSRALATPLVDTTTPMPHRQMYADEGPGAPRVRMAIRATFLDLPDERAVATIFERMQAQPSPMAAVQIRVLGGALARVPADATTFAHRGRAMMVTFAAGRQDLNEAEPHEMWVAHSLAAMRPATHGVPVSFLGEEGAARIHEACPDGTYRRLVAIKRRDDPTKSLPGQPEHRPGRPSCHI
jgi:FAD/FMN-containing dehydrogenase